MGKKKAALAVRAWRLVRLALFSARGGGAFKSNFMADLMPRYLKSLRAAAGHSIRYAERELSFDETPVFRFRLHKAAAAGASGRRKYLPRFACLNPKSLDVDDDDDEDAYNGDTRTSYSGYDMDGESVREETAADVAGKDGGIDDRAEEFIAMFYEQMKLQRQISYLQYHEMLCRGAS